MDTFFFWGGGGLEISNLTFCPVVGGGGFPK